GLLHLAKVAAGGGPAGVALRGGLGQPARGVILAGEDVLDAEALGAVAEAGVGGEPAAALVDQVGDLGGGGVASLVELLLVGVEQLEVVGQAHGGAVAGLPGLAELLLGGVGLAVQEVGAAGPGQGDA